MSQHNMRGGNGDTKLINVMGDYGVKSIDRLQAVADFQDVKWAFRLHLDGRLCGVRELMVMEDSVDPAARLLSVLQALKKLHDDENDPAHHHTMGDGNTC